ncbi:MAG: septum site-determining protein MinD [Provencibacterium sp.]|jgi:septum site-determining protein MinD|nr:septum site-determining protein MinD [Provencibacterium sp.]
MSHIKLVTSGKGGAGKSTVSVYSAAALVRRGRRVLLLEMDAGLRGLDILLGVCDRTVFDMSDVLEGRCEPVKAIVECAWCPGLHLMPAPLDRSFFPCSGDLARLCRGLSSYYDYLLIDTPAGLGIGFEVSLSVAQSAFIVATPDPVAVRDAASVAALIFERGLTDVKLLINRLPPRPGQMLVSDLDSCIDTVGAQLIGVIPEERALAAASARGGELPADSPAGAEFLRIAGRIEGEYTPLAIR